MTTTERQVRVDFTPSAAGRYGAGWAVVGVDVLRATTLLCTAAALGRRCLVGRDAGEGAELVRANPGALLGGEQGGHVPPEFDVGNSPAEMDARRDVERPLVLVTSSGTPLLRAAFNADLVFAASLRNMTAQVEHLLGLDVDVAVIGAGTRGERREEDDLVSTRIAAALMRAGLSADDETAAVVAEFAGSPIERCAAGPSARFLQSVGRQDDLDFVLSHVDDVRIVLEIRGADVVTHGKATLHAH